MKLRNPFGFRPGPVSFWTTVIYLAVTIPLIYVHETVPPAPSNHSLKQGLNLTEAWLDLQSITRAYHPFNSRGNERVREYLLDRSKDILDRNDISYAIEKAGGVIWDDSLEEPTNDGVEPPWPTARGPGATIFDDRISNATWTVDSLFQNSKEAGAAQGYYFEGSNFYVYIHGKDDPEGDWWESPSGAEHYHKTGGVLVNCHFDSVSTGYGATDDGVSCVSMLQLLSYFTIEGHQPKNGIVLLFNNGEEDGLFGARAFGYSPLLKFCHTFVNLEGAGAGGRAILFRTTDLQAAEAYGKSPHPFGSVIAANAFERGVVKSGTDFEVFAANFGQRGLDIAFYAPRSRYHTEDDDSRHTSVRSIWHMLSAALASTERLSQTTGTVFNGDRSDGNKHLIQNGKRTAGVWFDWFGSAWTAFPLRGLFAWSLTLLIATPLALMLVTYLLVRKDKYYFFARDIKLDSEVDDDRVALGGWRGFFRFPVAFVFAAALTIASVLLVGKLNPLIIYSSGYAVWAMTVSLFYFSFWLIMRGANFARPSALHRGFAIFWLFVLSWIFQVIAAIAEDRMHIGALYFAAFFHTAIFVALFIALVEQLALPGKHEFARQCDDAPREPQVCSSENTTAAGDDDQAGPGHDDSSEADTATETTPLRAGEQGYGSSDQTTFANTYRRSALADNTASAPSLRSYPPYEHEQVWSGRLPTWAWFLQFLVLAPVHVILVGNLGLVQMSAMGMTGTDGNSLLAPLMGVGMVTIFLLAPLTPFMHRITHHVPLFLLLVFVGTFIYNLVAFPFSVESRCKVYFQEVIDLNEGTEVVSLSGLEEFVRPVIASLPSAAGQHIKCGASTTRSSLVECQYDSSSLPVHIANGTKPADVITVTTSKSLDGKSAKLQVDALETKMCILDISQPIFGFYIKGGGASDRRFGSTPRGGLQRITLWRREWKGAWDVTLQLTDKSHLFTDGETETSKADKEREQLDGEPKGRNDDNLRVTVRCAYSDANDEKTIPALHELNQYMPKWAAITKATVGLVEVKKTYAVA